ncbi:unnamed protein product [Fusarium graminearum]|uniref:F-box domain-containing protein n=1 Tax=Gibberella zeae TaxID=5518 RepID=A0A4U9EU65_GIBZA|nr:unnamed protein product [Fusarium graminearum]CAG1963516.1 unnamed protein product [Fusarium graminearum]CAG1978819.1 unnamed protein product [Fusarium graminearum]CAG1993095.1 unnamed protein product [Fusarium graminearum]CAG1996233.1 unnamed protein product [Fusarium graminearum]
MASIEALPVETIYHIFDMCAEETIIDTELSTKAQLAWAQTSRRFYATIYPLIRPTMVCKAAEAGRLDVIKKAYQDGVDLNMIGNTQNMDRRARLYITP